MTADLARSRRPQELPFVTVIMPIRNEAAYIERSLGGVLGQSYPSERLEVLIVDGMSTDRTRGLIRDLAKGRKRVRLLDNPKMIVPTALNIGLGHAAGEIIIRVDGHCEIAPDYILRCVEALGNSGADCVGGAVETVGETPTARGIALAQSSPFGIGGVAFRTGKGRDEYVDTVAFGAYRREVFQRLGGFDETLVRHQDYEFNLRLRMASGKIFYTPKIKARYYSRASLRSLARQYVEYGYWKGRVARSNPRALMLRHLAPPALVAGIVVGAPLAVIGGCFRFAYLGGLGLYVSAVLVAAALVGLKGGRASIPALVAAFPAIHMSWGAGLWVGLPSRKRFV